MRGSDGDVRAFANTCRHRGALLAQGEGNCHAFRCPYHSWAYDIDGALIVAPQMDQTKGFDPDGTATLFGWSAGRASCS